MTDISGIIEAVSALILAVVSTFLIPWLKEKYGAQKLAKIQTWVTAAVKAAEMIFDGTGLGEKKKAYVEKFLHDHGVTIDAQALDVMIEAAVLELQGAIKE